MAASALPCHVPRQPRPDIVGEAKSRVLATKPIDQSMHAAETATPNGFILRRILTQNVSCITHACKLELRSDMS